MIYKISASAACPSATLSNIEAGGHRMIIDEPVGRGGMGLGATPLEVLVSALVGCTNVISNRIAAQMNMCIHSMNVSAVADLDARVLSGEHTEIAFPKVRIDVEVISDALPNQFAALRERLERTCPVSVLFKQAGTRIEHRWSITPPTPAPTTT